MATDTSTAPLHCLVVTPEATVVDTGADFVALPLYDGEMGIARQHSPMIGRLGYGELRITTDGQQQCYYVDGGFVQVVGDEVSVLTSRAIPANDLDAERASELLRQALAKAALGSDQLAIRERLVAQARGQLRVARKR